MTAPFPAKREDETYQDWAMRLNAYTYVLDREIDGLKRAVVAFDGIEASVRQLKAWCQ